MEQGPSRRHSCGADTGALGRDSATGGLDVGRKRRVPALARVGRGGRGAIGGFGAWHDHVRSWLDGRGETLVGAPFVSAKNASPAEVDAMYRQMVEIVRSEGGFAQHAVVVTSDSRYLGEVPFASW